MKKKIIWGTIIVVLIGGAIAAWYAWSEFERKPETAADKETDAKVEAEQIMQEYVKDLATAESKYKDKTIEFSGKIVEMQVEDPNDLSISLETSAVSEDGFPRSVRVTLISDMADAIKSLKVGDKVTVKGIYNGFDADLVFNRGIIIE